MKVAIIHDHFLHFGGAERVLISLLKLYPHADVYTSFITKENLSLLKSITTGGISVFPFNTFPFAHKYPDMYKPIIYLYWESLDLSKYNLVISSSHSFSSKSVITAPKTLHVSYIYTPPRYLYTEYNETQLTRKPFFKYLFLPFFSYMRMQDYISAQRPDIVLASSKEVKQRINKYYRRNSVVIYPPVITPQKVNTSTKKEYYLCVSRLVKQKGIELAIRACNQLHLPLLIIGKGKQEKFLKSISGPTIQFKGFVPDARMDALYEKAIALIYCSLEEDFGIVPVEAMGYGLPVIAYDSGAVKETVIPGKTGILFKEYTLSSITAAIKEFEKNKFDPKICRKQANKFSEMKFIASIKKMTSAKIKYD